jgi:hypothetical protein
MTKKQLESMVFDIKKPNLNQGEVRKLLDFGDDNIVPIQKVQIVTQPVPQIVAQQVPQIVAQPVPQRVTQSEPQRVTQPVPQRVAQLVPQRVTQPVAQSLWVAQNNNLSSIMNIAEAIGQKVVKPYKPKAINRKSEKSSYDQSVWEGVEKLKEYIYNLPTIEDRKKFVLNIGWGIGEESRGKKNYLYGAKKINSIKYKLYIGNPTHL